MASPRGVVVIRIAQGGASARWVLRPVDADGRAGSSVERHVERGCQAAPRLVGARWRVVRPGDEVARALRLLLRISVAPSGGRVGPFNHRLAGRRPITARLSGKRSSRSGRRASCW